MHTPVATPIALPLKMPGSRRFRCLGTALLSTGLVVGWTSAAWALPGPAVQTEPLAIQAQAINPAWTPNGTLQGLDLALLLGADSSVLAANTEPLQGADSWRQSKAAALVLGILAPGMGHAYVGRWDKVGTTLLWWGGGAVVSGLGTLLMFTGGEAGMGVGLVGSLIGPCVMIASQIAGAIEAMNLAGQPQEGAPRRELLEASSDQPAVMATVAGR